MEALLFVVTIGVIIGLMTLWLSEGAAKEAFTCALLIGLGVIFTLWLWWFTTPVSACLHFDSASHEFFQGGCVGE